MTLSKIANGTIFHFFFSVPEYNWDMVTKARRRFDFKLNTQKCISSRKLFQYFLPFGKSVLNKQNKNWIQVNLGHLQYVAFEFKSIYGIDCWVFIPSGAVCWFGSDVSGSMNKTTLETCALHPNIFKIKRIKHVPDVYWPSVFIWTN